MASHGAAPNGPGIHFPPPLLLVGSFLTGWILETRVRTLPLASDDSAALELAGAIALAAGFAFSFWGIWTFHRARTAIMPTRPASTFVTSGPYRFSRNPMYVGLTAAYTGLSVMANTLWPIVLLPLALAALHGIVIRREERYLAAHFGSEYTEYRRRVRRWL